jgi:hypothetical protein
MIVVIRACGGQCLQKVADVRADAEIADAPGIYCDIQTGDIH